VTTPGPSWARRYGASHRRLCARPGCGSPAAATLRFQPTRREAWLVDLDESAARTEGDLCARHAAGLVLPRGWELHSNLSVDLGVILGTDAPPAPRSARRARGASIARARRRRSSMRPMALPGLSAVPDPEPGEPTEVLAEPEVGSESWPEAPAAGVSEGEAEPAAEVPPEPAATPSALGPADGATSAALAETLDAQTPLLRRAFSNVWLPDADS